jgi:hypothetical protein
MKRSLSQCVTHCGYALIFLLACEPVVEVSDVFSDEEVLFQIVSPQSSNPTAINKEPPENLFLPYASAAPAFTFDYSSKFVLKEIDRDNKDFGEVKFISLEYVDANEPEFAPANSVYFQNKPRITIQVFELPKYQDVNDAVEKISNGGALAYVDFTNYLFLRAKVPALTDETAYFVTQGVNVYAIAVYNYPVTMFDEKKNNALNDMLMGVVQTFAIN